MGRYLIKLENYFLEWSTVVDAPVSFGMSLDELKEYIKAEYGNEGMIMLPERLQRIEKTGTSAIGYNVNQVIQGNRAGPKESKLTKKEIYEAYCQQKPIRNGWMVPTVEVGE